MADREKTGDDQESSRHREADAEEQPTRGKDVMRGRSFAETNWANDERGQTNERERVAEHGANLDEFGEMVTDSEIEAREERRAERNED